MSRRISVCVVGAGAAGLCAARHMVDQPSLFSFHVYEQAAGVGGTWIYTDSIGTDDNYVPVHSSMYANLRTNIMQEIMGFPDVPFPEADGTSYPKHEVVLKYLQDYASRFNLIEHISFRTVVKSVQPLTAERDSGWEVIVYSMVTKKEETREFDAVMICSGHYSSPLVPEIPGIEQYEGELYHSHDFRRAELFAGRKVALLGAAASGRDIALEVARYAMRVFLCHRGGALGSSFPSNVDQVESISAATSKGFILEDKSVIEVDALIYCTGYMYTFPFLNPKCKVSVRGRRVRFLYKHIINIEKPTLGFIGIPFIVLPFPLFHYQVAFFLKSLINPEVLPSTEEMYEDEKQDFLYRLSLGYPARHAHKMAQLQWNYNDELADVAEIKRLDPLYRELYEINSHQMLNFITTFKTKCYTNIYNEKRKM